jgi:hypothetical protein
MSLGITEKHWKFSSLAFLWTDKNADRECPGKPLVFLAKNRLFRAKTAILGAIKGQKTLLTVTDSSTGRKCKLLI